MVASIGARSTSLGTTKSDPAGNAVTHYVTISGLSPNTAYYFQVRSGASTDNNDGAFYSVTTGPTLAPSPGTTIYGRVYQADGVTPVAYAIVHLQVPRAGGDSQIASARTDASGYWYYSLDNLRAADFQTKFNPVAGETLQIKANAGPVGYRSVSTVVPSSTGSVGNITLGSPLAVSLESLDAAVEGDAIRITWETVNEIGNLGFNLYRDTATEGPGGKLNSSLIPSQSPDGLAGYVYSYLDDANLVPGTTYFYWLEDVSLAGIAKRHGPVNATIPGDAGPNSTVFLPLIITSGEASSAGIEEAPSVSPSAATFSANAGEAAPISVSEADVPTAHASLTPEAVTGTGAAVTLDLLLVPGWNLIAIPVQRTSVYTAQAALDELNALGGNCSEVDRWLDGGWDAHINGLPFNDFDLAPGQGYFVQCASAVTWPVTGEPIMAPVGLSLTPGWNLVALPYGPHADQAQAWLNDIIAQGGGATEVNRWLDGGWDAHIDGLPFNDFAIAKPGGYFVKMDNSASYVPEPPTQTVCGTISSNTTWTSDKIWKLTCNVTINSGVTLTVEPETVIKSTRGKYTISSADRQRHAWWRRARPLSPIVFTSFKDDRYGGDTNNDGSGSDSRPRRLERHLLQPLPARAVTSIIVRIQYAGRTYRIPHYDPAICYH